MAIKKTRKSEKRSLTKRRIGGDATQKVKNTLATSAASAATSAATAATMAAATGLKATGDFYGTGAAAVSLTGISAASGAAIPAGLAAAAATAKFASERKGMIRKANMLEKLNAEREDRDGANGDTFCLNYPGTNRVWLN